MQKADMHFQKSRTLPTAKAAKRAWTPSEKVAIARALEEELAGRRGSNQYKTKELPDNCSEAEPGKESREIAAEKAGFGSHMTYRRAKRVVDHGAEELVGAMDAGARPQI